jgi:hypothetical protein
MIGDEERSSRESAAPRADEFITSAALTGRTLTSTCKSESARPKKELPPERKQGGHTPYDSAVKKAVAAGATSMVTVRDTVFFKRGDHQEHHIAFYNKKTGDFTLFKDRYGRRKPKRDKADSLFVDW